MPSPITPDVIYELTSVSAPSVSPDGSRLAFVRSKVDRETKKAGSQVMMMALPDGEAVPFTSGDSDASPRFSPDGKTLAFIRPGDKERKQLWVMPTSGGEARRLTLAAGGVAEFAWSPDSRALVFVSDVDPDRPTDGRDPQDPPRVRVVRRIRYRSDTAGWRGDAHRHLFVVDAATGECRQLTDGDWDDYSPIWSPDGDRIAFISERGTDRDFVLESQAYVLPAGGGEPEGWSRGLSGVVSVGWSPDGRRLVCLGSDDPEVLGCWQGRLYALERGGVPIPLTDDSVCPVGGFPGSVPAPELRWTREGRVLFLGDRRGESFLYEADLSTGALRAIAGGGAQLSALSVDGASATAAAVAVTPHSAGDLSLIDLRLGSRRRLTAYNDAYFAEHPTGRMEKFTIPRGGADIESRVVLPPGFDASRRWPLVVDIHGGPHGVFHDAFSAVQQVLAGAGYVVLAVNPRGSSTYGLDFMKAVIRDWGGEDYLDIMAAVDEMSSRPYVDTSRMGVTGYSYGGFMSAWIVGHDSRFKAAVVGAPCINLSSMYGTSDIGVSFGEAQWGGMRADADRVFVERSPLTYAPRVETPVLLLHGEEDYRCPIGQSEEMFVTLKRLGKEVELVRFPGCAHSFLRTGHPRLRREYLSRTVAWFNRHMGSRAAGAERQSAPAPAPG